MTRSHLFCFETGEWIEPDPRVDYSLLGARLMEQVKPRPDEEFAAILRGAVNDA